MTTEPTPDRVALRDRIAEVLRPHASLGGTPPRYELPFFDGATPGLPRISGWKPLDAVADAVLAVLPEPTDRAAVLLEAADLYAKLADQNEAYELAEHGSIDHESRLQHETVRDVVAGLRRLAAEAQPTSTPETEV